MNIKELEKRMAALQGNVGLEYRNMITGETVSINSDRAFDAASLPKIGILAVVLKLAHEGVFSLDDRVTVTDSQKVGGCGAIKSMAGEVNLDVLSVLKLMITISDNTATNAMIRLVGLEKLNEEFRKLGFEKTRLERFYCDDDAHERGLRNYVCAVEVADLLQKIHERKLVCEEVSEMAESILLTQQIRHKIPGYIGRSFKIANKTGEDSGTTHDAALVYAAQPFVLVICSDCTDVPETERFIREIALEFYSEIPNPA